MKFKVVIPVYNAEKWIERCIKSVFAQESGDFEVIVIDDCSIDKTWEIVKSYSPVLYTLKNTEHNGSGLANIVKGINFLSIDVEDIIVTVDGDDYLANNKVFEVLSEAYRDDAWLTYGSFLPESRLYSGTCQDLKRTETVNEVGEWVVNHLTPETYRKSGVWVTSHLRTFKRWLWDGIKNEHLRDQDGQYYKVAWDMAFMYPMIEMAGNHIRFIDKVLYMYNDLTGMNDGTIRPMDQLRTAKEIQKKHVYNKI